MLPDLFPDLLLRDELPFEELLLAILLFNAFTESAADLLFEERDDDFEEREDVVLEGAEYLVVSDFLEEGRFWAAACLSNSAKKSSMSLRLLL